MDLARAAINSVRVFALPLCFDVISTPRSAFIYIHEKQIEPASDWYCCRLGARTHPGVIFHPPPPTGKLVFALGTGGIGCESTSVCFPIVEASCVVSLFIERLEMKSFEWV